MAAMTIDPASPAGQRLSTALIGWLTTVSPAGRPQPSPVWFLWQGGDILVYSLADTARIRNIAANPLVSLNLDGDAPSAAEVPEYLAKYAERFATYGWTPEWFAARYPVAIRIRPTRLRAW